MLFVIALALVVAGDVRAATKEEQEEEDSLGKKFKDFFTRGPAASPTPSKKKSRKKKAKPSPSPASKAKPKPKSKAAAEKPSPTATPDATVTPEPSSTASPTPAETPRARPTPSITPRTVESPTITPTPRPKTTPTPKATPTPTPSPKTTPTPTPSPKATSTPTPIAEKKPAPISTISSAEISGYDKNPPEVQKILDLALHLTTLNLTYKYGSADPAKGGMDCSGFIHYVLSKNGISDPPRDAREQYIWVRKAGNFQAVLGHSDDTFELDALKPGDLLFWSGTYSVDRDPAITHTMIYLGREKSTNRRIMVGASDGRTYKGQSRFGVSVFDFKVSGRRASSDDKTGPAFVGYARIPGWSGADRKE